MNKFFSSLLLFTLLYPPNVFGAMSGGDYEIYADTIGVTGIQVSEGGDYTLFGTGGDVFASTTEDGTYTLHGGFLAAERGSMELSLDTSSVTLGTLSANSVASDSVVATAVTENSTGYTLTLTSDGHLRSGANDINNVSDGTVTAGSEEYGVTTSGADSQVATDVSTAGSVTLASSAGSTTGTNTTVTFKASIAQATVAGTYAQTVTFTLTDNP